jgi:iron(III) transport system ATP-binding protein
VALPAAPQRDAASAHLAFRPHAVRFDEGVVQDGLKLEGRVTGAEFLGEFVRYEIRVNDAVVTADQPHHRGGERIPEGTLLRMSVPATELRLIPG